MGETRRWEGDETGRGVAGATHLTGGVRALLAAMAEPDWVAEDAEPHLLPHIHSAEGDSVRVVGAEVSDAGELVVALEITPDAREERVHARTRALAYGVIGQFAESSTFVEERALDDGAEFVVVTGMLSGKTPFVPHGHTVRLVVRSFDTLRADGS